MVTINPARMQCDGLARLQFRLDDVGPQENRTDPPAANYMCTALRSWSYHYRIANDHEFLVNRHKRRLPITLEVFIFYNEPTP